MSGILDSYQDSTDQALEVMAARPLEAETPKPKHSGWTTIPRAVAAGVVEVGANLTDIAGAYGQAASMQYVGNPLVSEKTQQQAQESYDKLTTEGIDWRSPAAKPAYAFSRDLRPDPLTAGTAENIVFGLTKGLTKAVGSATLFGLAGGATVFGTSEGMTIAEDLAVQGVDKSTRTKVGLVTGAVSAASVALPVAGQTLKQTAALVAVGGPLSFMGMMQASRSILENADYADLAAQYDPLDPVGLAVSTLLPAGFAAYAKRGGFSPKPADVPTATPDTPPVSPDAPPPDAPTGQARPTPDQIDAVMVHNLTAARDAHEDAPAKAADTPTLIEPSTPNLESTHPEQADFGKGTSLTRTNYREQDGIGYSEYTNPRTGVVDVYLAGFGDNDFVAYMRVYENGQPTNKFTSKLERQTEQAGATKAMLQGLAAVLPKGHTYMENDTISTDGIRHFQNQLRNGYEVARNPDGTPQTTQSNLSGASRENDIGIGRPGDFTNLQIRTDAEFDRVVDAVLPLLQPFGLGREAIRREGSEVVVDVPVLNRSVDLADPNILNQTAQKPADAAPAETATPQDQATPARAEAIKTETPDLPVEVTEDGTLITAAKKLDDARKLAQEGTDTELGALDAPLLKVAAECFLSAA